jgi:hypothetical protein
VFSCVSRGLLVASLGQFSGITGVYQATEDKPNGWSVETDPGYLGSTSACCAAKWVKLSESWPKFKFAVFHILLLYITQHKFILYK